MAHDWLENARTPGTHTLLDCGYVKDPAARKLPRPRPTRRRSKMPTCSWCGVETGGHWYRRVDGTRGVACLANARHRRGQAAHQLMLDLGED